MKPSEATSNPDQQQAPGVPTAFTATTAGARYDALFTTLHGRGEGAFVPFFVLGDPDLETSARLLRAAVHAGADALEVGIPFSDPIADGPTLQRAGLRAAAAGATSVACLELLAAFRAEFPTLPIGLLTYANLVVSGGIDAFYARVARAGVDSVLIADVPLLEAEPFSRAARARGIAPILLAPPNLPRARIRHLAALSDGYTYCVARRGVTGVQTAAQARSRPAAGHAAPRAAGVHPTLIAELRAAAAPPPLVGFGVAAPAHVRAALGAGAAGAVSGSAVAALIEIHLSGATTPEALRADPTSLIDALTTFIRAMKEATHAPRPE